MYSFNDAAVFNHPAHLINIPIYDEFEPAELEFLSSTGVADSNAYEFDFMLNYALTKQLKVGVTLINSEDLVANIHCNFYKFDKIGVRRICNYIR